MRSGEEKFLFEYFEEIDSFTFKCKKCGSIIIDNEVSPYDRTRTYFILWKHFDNCYWANASREEKIGFIFAFWRYNLKCKRRDILYNRFYRNLKGHGKRKRKNPYSYNVCLKWPPFRRLWFFASSYIDSIDSVEKEAIQILEKALRKKSFVDEFARAYCFDSLSICQINRLFDLLGFEGPNVCSKSQIEKYYTLGV